jgi:hypothetical protein
MKKSFTFFLAFFFCFSISLLAQSMLKDISQAPQNFNNPEVVYGPAQENPTGTLFESFEDPAFPPAGWVKYSPDGGTGWERITAGTTPIPGWNGGTVTVPPDGGNAVAFCTWSTGGATSNDQWLASSQVMNIQSGDSLTFWLRKFSNLYADNVDILISTTDQQMGSFTITVDNLVYAQADTGWVFYGYNLTDFVNPGDNIYIAFREHVTDNLNEGAAIFVDLVSVSGNAVPVTPISIVREDLNGDYIPDHLDSTFTIQGIVISPNFQTNNISYFIDDGTGGIDVLHFGSTTPVLNLGDEVMVTGVVDQYYGLTELVAANESDIVVVSMGNPVPSPIVLTLGQFFDDPEAYESRLVGFMNLDKAGGTWPAEGSSGTIQMTDGSDTIDLYIDSDTDIDGQPEPNWPKDIIAIGSQHTSSDPPNDGYEIEPRYYDTDFLPPFSLPVELTAFTVKANLNSVLLNWNTASEINNYGFEIQRNAGGGFITVGFVQGNGTTIQPHAYSYVNRNVSPGHYTYRLKQIDFQGSYSFSSEVSVDVYPASYSLEQNYPNPFNPTTIINFNLKVDSKVALKVFNVLGQQVAQLAGGEMTAGNHQVNFDASQLSSGVYFYRLEANGADGSTWSAVKKMILTR